MTDTATARTSRPAGYALAAACVTLALWSGTTVANKVAVQYVDGLTAGVLRSLLAGLLALAVAVLCRLPFPASTGDRLWLTASGLASFAAWPALLSVGVTRTTAGHAGLMMAMTPVFTVLLAALLEARLPLGRWWLGAVAAFAGTAGLLAGRSAAPQLFDADGSLTGNLVVLTGSAICAAGYVAGARLTSTIGALATTLWGLAIALLALVPAFVLIADATD